MVLCLLLFVVVVVGVEVVVVIDTVVCAICVLRDVCDVIGDV